MESGLHGQVILVTGAAGGIGSALCRSLAREGAAIGLHYSTSKDSATALAAELRGGDPPAEVFLAEADLRREDAVERLFGDVASGLGRIDGLVINAGVWPADPVPIAQMPLSQWRNTLDVNLTGAFLCARAFVAHLEARGATNGSLVFIGSTAGRFGEEGHGDYAASKAALHGLTLTLKNEIARRVPFGRVNLVDPGWVATPMAQEALEDREVVERVQATMALRKIATPDDIAHAALFLLSDRLSGHLTGERITVAGGMEGRLLHPPSG